MPWVCVVGWCGAGGVDGMVGRGVRLLVVVLGLSVCFVVCCCNWFGLWSLGVQRMSRQAGLLWFCFRCWVAMVEVLKTTRSRTFSALDPGRAGKVSSIILLILDMKEGSVYREFFTLGYPLPDLNLLKFRFSVTDLWSLSTGAVA